MSNVAQLIDLIAQGKNAEAADLLNSELLARSYSAVEALKPEIATNYFAPVISIDAEGQITTQGAEDDEEVESEEETTEEESEE